MNRKISANEAAAVVAAHGDGADCVASNPDIVAALLGVESSFIALAKLYQVWQPARNNHMHGQFYSPSACHSHRAGSR
jgi:hypothetical protein